MQQLALPVRHEWLVRERGYGKIAMEPFEPAWKGVARCEPDGTRPGMRSSVSRCCGSIQESGPGLECSDA